MTDWDRPDAGKSMASPERRGRHARPTPGHRNDHADPHHHRGAAAGRRRRLPRALLGARRTALAARHRGLAALTGRETARVLKLWTQTILAPVLSSFLFIAVFGLSLGGRIREIGGVDYEVFIVPGLVTMAMIQAAYANNSASVFQARFDRYLNDVLAAPMRSWEVNLALSLGG